MFRNVSEQLSLGLLCQSQKDPSAGYGADQQRRTSAANAASSYRLGKGAIPAYLNLIVKLCATKERIKICGADYTPADLMAFLSRDDSEPIDLDDFDDEARQKDFEEALTVAYSMYSTFLMGVPFYPQAGIGSFRLCHNMPLVDSQDKDDITRLFRTMFDDEGEESWGTRAEYMTHAIKLVGSVVTKVKGSPSLNSAVSAGIPYNDGRGTTRRRLIQMEERKRKD